MYECRTVLREILLPPCHDTASITTSDDQIQARHEFKSRLLRFYMEHNPQGITNIDALLETYRGKEHLLLESLDTLYGTEDLRLDIDMHVLCLRLSGSISNNRQDKPQRPSFAVDRRGSLGWHATVHPNGTIPDHGKEGYLRIKFLDDPSPISSNNDRTSRSRRRLPLPLPPSSFASNAFPSTRVTTFKNMYGVVHNGLFTMYASAITTSVKETGCGDSWTVLSVYMEDPQKEGPFSIVVQVQSAAMPHMAPGDDVMTSLHGHSRDLPPKNTSTRRLVCQCQDELEFHAWLSAFHVAIATHYVTQLNETRLGTHLVAFYQARAPDRVPQVPLLVDMFQGHEAELLATMDAIYQTQLRTEWAALCLPTPQKTRTITVLIEGAMVHTQPIPAASSSLSSCSSPSVMTKCYGVLTRNVLHVYNTMEEYTNRKKGVDNDSLDEAAISSSIQHNIVAVMEWPGSSHSEYTFGLELTTTTTTTTTSIFCAFPSEDEQATAYTYIYACSITTDSILPWCIHPPHLHNRFIGSPRSSMA